MSTPSYIDSETITQAHLVDTDTESEPEETPSEAEESLQLGSRVAFMSEEFEASEPSGTRTISYHSSVSSGSTTPLSLDHPLTHALPTRAAALSTSSYHKRYRSSYEKPSPSLSLTLLVQKRFRGLGYGEARRRALESTEEIAPSTYETTPSPEWSLGSLPVSPSSPVVPSPISSPVATPAATISIDKD
nr:hypothetical protein [Tanacetum cinerariifolium]